MDCMAGGSLAHVEVLQTAGGGEDSKLGLSKPHLRKKASEAPKPPLLKRLLPTVAESVDEYWALVPERFRKIITALLSPPLPPGPLPMPIAWHPHVPRLAGARRSLKIYYQNLFSLLILLLQGTIHSLEYLLFFEVYISFMDALLITPQSPMKTTAS